MSEINLFHIYGFVPERTLQQVIGDLWILSDKLKANQPRFISIRVTADPADPSAVIVSGVV